MATTYGGWYQPVLAETDYMVSRQFDTASEIAFLEDVAVGRYTLAASDNDDHRLALEVVKKYRDLDIGITDASNVVLAHRYQITRLLTLNQHYRAISPLGAENAFTMLPADG
jgi:hypothetical protein